MEAAEDEHLVEHVPVQVPDDALQVVAAGGEGGEVGPVAAPHGGQHLEQGDALDQLAGQHQGRGIAPVDPGDLLQPLPPGLLVEPGGLARLHQVVQLVRRPAGELVDHLTAARRAEEARPVQHAAHGVHQGDVGLQQLPDAGALHLDRHRLAAGQDGPVHLPDRGGGERLGREGAEDRLGGPAELPLDDLPDLRVGERADLVEQPEQLVAVGGREEVEAQGQHLAQLDPGPPQLLQRGAHPHRPGERPAAQQGQGRQEGGPAEDDQHLPHAWPVRQQQAHAGLRRGRRPASRGAPPGAGRPTPPRRARHARRGRSGHGRAQSVEGPRHAPGRRCARLRARPRPAGHGAGRSGGRRAGKGRLPGDILPFAARVDQDVQALAPTSSRTRRPRPRRPAAPRARTARAARLLRAGRGRLAQRRQPARPLLARPLLLLLRRRASQPRLAPSRSRVAHSSTSASVG